MEKRTDLNNDYVVLKRIEGIVYVTYRSKITIDLNSAKKIVEARVRFQNNTPSLVLCDISALFYMDYEARNYLATIGSKLIEKVALYCGSKQHKSMANYFVAVCNPTVPTKIYTDLSEAIDYLRSKP